MADLKALLDAFDAKYPEEQKKELDGMNTYFAVEEAVKELQPRDEKMKNTLFGVGMIAGLKYCPHCKQKVSPMTKCSVQRGTYHTELVEY